ncbi:Chromodomain Y-like protein [Chionoecetes opilio]|uniref:Chromodomain Y-like protein n=1 Tax=Chionoecetes opilio TaxID=41210 RepID=A0A8J5CJ82_CHIOP|nr:Chromodomain Y-like protein [Chionoecetes opilio]
MPTTETLKAKETDPAENSVPDMKDEVTQTLDSTKPGDCEPQIVEVQRGSRLDQDNADSVPLVSQRCSPKQTKRKDIPIRKKMKKGLMQSHIIAQLEQSGDDLHEENEDVNATKVQEVSEEAGAVKTCESSEVVETLPPSQKEIEVQEVIPEAQPIALTSASAPEVHSSSTTKTKDKVPRILKQLFLDEGVQNMLKSMGEDSGAVPETSPNSDSGTHKLRPKRITEPILYSSPEFDAMEALLTSSRKKKRGTETDTLYIDEGILNLLTSKEQPSRRTNQDDAASDVSQASSSKSFKTSKATKSGEALSDSRKRKLSGASTTSNTSSSSKSLQPPEPKKVRVETQESAEDPYELDMAEEFKERPVIVGYGTLETMASVAKKKGILGVPSTIKPKYKGVKMQLKVQKQKQLKSVVVGKGSKCHEEGTSNMAQVPDTPVVSKEVFPEAGSLPTTLEASEVSSKAVPPIKIKLASDSVTIKPVPRPSLPPQQPPEVTIIAKPPPVRLPIKPQVVDVISPSHTIRALPVPQVRASPEKPRPLQDRHSPSPLPRRMDNLAGPVPPPPGLLPQVDPSPHTPQNLHVGGGPTKQSLCTTHRGTMSRALKDSFPSLIRNCDATVTAAAVAAAAAASKRQRIGGESLRQSQRASVRQSEANYHFRDIALKKFNNFTQIILSPSTTKMKNALNSRVLRELCEALSILKRDESVRIVLLTGTGSTFCQGVDLTPSSTPTWIHARRMQRTLDFLKALVQFPKPIIAGVNGNAMGLGVTMLPLFDMVIANDKAEFCLPYAKLGQVPEGGATYTFPNLCGKLQSTQLFLGHKLTARRAQEMGLVSESIWPATYQQELIPKVALLATQSAQVVSLEKEIAHCPQTAPLMSASLLLSLLPLYPLLLSSYLTV